MYGYDNYQKIKNETERRRLAAIASADARNAEVRSVSDEIREIDRELVGTGLLLFRTACEGKDITPIKERNIELMTRRRAELVRLGYPEDYTEVRGILDGIISDETEHTRELGRLLLRE